MNLWGVSWTAGNGGSWKCPGAGLILRPYSNGRWCGWYRDFRGMPGATKEEALRNLLGDPIMVLGHTFYPLASIYRADHLSLPILGRIGEGWSAYDIDSCDHPPGYQVRPFPTADEALASYLDAWYQHNVTAALAYLNDANKWRALLRGK